MKPTLTALIVIAALAGCSRTNLEPFASTALASAPTSDTTLPVYPPLQADAKDGAVFDYY
jgi:hypothetical protein